MNRSYLNQSSLFFEFAINNRPPIESPPGQSGNDPGLGLPDNLERAEGESVGCRKTGSTLTLRRNLRIAGYTTAITVHSSFSMR